MRVKAGKFYFQLLVCFFLIVFNLSHATTDTDRQEPLEFIYVNSNIGEAAGGHTALRIGDHVFHYQFFPNGHFLLVRDSWQQFFFFYHELFNRSIYLASLSLTKDDYSKIKNQFTRLLIEQQQSLNTLKEGEANKRLLDELIHQNRSLNIPRLGLFDSSDKSEAMLKLLIRLKTHLPASFFNHQISQVKKDLQQLLASLNNNSTEKAITRIQKKWALLAALQVLEQSSKLNPEIIFYPLANEKPLSQQEKEVLSQYAQQLEHSILSLLQSSRPDNGSALLLQMAKYQVIILSLNTGYLTTLDPFPEPVKSVSINDEERAILERLYDYVKNNAQIQRQLFFAELFAETKHYEIAWSLLESSRARFYELDQGIKHEQVVRLSAGTLIPSHTGKISLTDFPVKVNELQSLAHKIDTQHNIKNLQIEKQLSYHITQNNCVTELMQSLNSAFKSPLEAKKSLGAWLSPGEEMSFIPFVFYQKILAEYHIKETQIIPSRRLKNLADLYHKQPDDKFMIWLHENNVLSSTLYKVRKEDTPFLFFTDDQVLLRPVLGVINFSYAAIHGVISLFTLPIDQGDGLYQASRGLFFSLPELVFWNIRKGTYGHTNLTPTEASP